ncbi:hypothetical protein RLIN73S_04827 [Rhodanobacter lindaniclasticus]
MESASASGVPGVMPSTGNSSGANAGPRPALVPNSATGLSWRFQPYSVEFLGVSVPGSPGCICRRRLKYTVFESWLHAVAPNRTRIERAGDHLAGRRIVNIRRRQLPEPPSDTPTATLLPSGEARNQLIA